MTTFRELADAWVASRDLHNGELSRLTFWVDQLGPCSIRDITEDQVDQAIVRLRERGRMKAGRGSASQPVATGKPLAEATVNRFISTLASVFKYARHCRVVPRSHDAPTKGIEKAPEPVDPNKCFRPDEVERLLKVTRVVDQRWGKMNALILLGFHTGLRVGNLMDMRWRDLDLDKRVAHVHVTKNGRPIVAVLTDRCVEELRRLTAGSPDELIFRSYRSNGKFNYRKLWKRVCAEAGFEGRTFHWLRHGCGSALANAGASQAQIMQVMGHRTLVASARYMHSNVEDKRRVVEGVFG